MRIPPTLYQRWLAWLVDVAATPAGEHVRAVTRARAVEVGLLPAAGPADWWLLDDRRLIVMGFDDRGRLVGMVETSDREAVRRARTHRDLAIRLSAPAPTEA